MSQIRVCPNCENKTINPEELFSGANCQSCHKIIEVNATYSWGISIALLAIALASFKYEQAMIGLISTVALVIYASAYKTVALRYLPLKIYKDAN